MELEQDNVEVIYYEWDVVSLSNLFNYSHDYKFINKLLLIWLKYLAFSIWRLDDHVSNALKAIVNKDKNAKERTMPLCKFIFNV